MRARKLLYAAIGVLLSLIILDWSLPYLIDTEMIRNRIHQQFSELTGGEIEFERLHLDLLPWPRIEMHEATLSIPPNIQVTAEAVQIYPNLRALFFSQASVAEIRLVSGNLTVNLTPAGPDAESTNNILDPQLTLRNLQSRLTHIPNLHIGLKHSRVQLRRGKQLLVELNEVDASINHSFESLMFEVSCASTNWKRIRVAGQLNEESMKGQGDITLEEFKLTNLDSLLADDSPIHIEDGLANVDLHFRIDGLTTFSASGTGSLPSIILVADQQQLELRIESGQFVFNDEEIQINRLNGSFGRSTFDGLSGNLAFKADFPAQFSTDVSKLELAELQNWLTSFEPLKKLADYRIGEQSRIELTEASLDGPLLQPNRWKFNLSGKLDSIEIANLPDLEKPLTIDSGSFKLDAETLQYDALHFRALDADGTVSGFQRQYRSGFKHDGRISLTAHLGKNASQHLGHLFNLERKFRLPPLNLDAAEISWKSSDKIRLSGVATIEKGPKIVAEINYDSEELNIHRLRVTDQFSSALMALQLSKSLINLSFKGNLDRVTMKPFVIKNNNLLGSIHGDFYAKINLRHPVRSTTHGKLKGEKVNLAGFLDIPLLVHNFVLKADDNKIYLQATKFALADNQMTATGSLAPRGNTLQIDLNLATSFFNWESIANNRDSPQPPESTSQTAHSSLPALRGKIRFQAERFKFHQFIWTPLNAELNFTEQKTVLNLSNTRLCGISTPTRIEHSAEQVIRIKIRPSAKNQPIEPTLECLFGKHLKIDGNFNLSGEIKTVGTQLESPKSFKGQLLLDAQNGRIHKNLVFFKLLDYLNATNILTGNLAELKKSGVAYNSVHTRIGLSDGILHFSDFAMDGPTMKLAGVGEIDLDKQTLNAKFLVAPLSTINQILDYVPIVGDILEDAVSVPVEIKGPLKDPQVTPLSPAAISTHLMDIFSRTINTPVKLIQPIRPENNE